MSVFEVFEDYLDGQEYETEEEYNADVLRLSADIEEDLGRAERWALSHDPEVYKQLGVTIKGVYPEPEEGE